MALAMVDTLLKLLGANRCVSRPDNAKSARSDWQDVTARDRVALKV